MKKKFNLIIKTSILLIMVTFVAYNQSSIQKEVNNDTINKRINLSTMALKVEENNNNDIYRTINSYTGDLTGYIYNCPLCSGRLACNSRLDLSGGLTYYTDPTYGNVRIVASSTNFSCGTIVRMYSSRLSDEPIIAIVLDRGVRGNALDLLTESMDAARTVGRSSINYDVLRIGYGENES